MSIDIVVRFTDEQAAALKAEKVRSGASTSEFIRRAVVAALYPGGYHAYMEATFYGKAVDLPKEEKKP